MPPKRWGQHAESAPTERRIDPADSKEYTFDEVCEVYRSKYSHAQIRAYWNSDMRPVPGGKERVDMDVEEEQRVDPEDGQAYTFSSVKVKYAGQYSHNALRQYWKDTMKPSGSPGARPASSSGPSPETRGAEGGVQGELPPKAEQLRVSFCPDPKTIGEKFTLTYDKDPTSNFASVNPGDQGLRVGGATLNGQFQKDLYNLAWQETEKYGPYHQKLFAVAEPGKFTRASEDLLATNPNLMAGFAFKASEGGKVSTVFVDIFRPEVRVHKHEKNLGMVYTIGPKRQDNPNDQIFLLQVETTAQNLSVACSQYNALALAEGLPAIEVLRMPLVSGGAFAGRCPKDAVAAALIRGLIAGCGADTPELNFAFDGDIFNRTWKGFKS